MKLYVAMPDVLPDIWASIQPYVQSVADRSSGKIELRDVLDMILKEEVRLFVIVDEETNVNKGICMGRVMQYPHKKILELTACSGEDAVMWVDLISEIEAWAKYHGCEAIEPYCRAGWEKFLVPRGYRRTHVVLEKQL